MRTPLVAVVVVGLGAVAFGAGGQHAPTARQEPATRAEPVAVPTGDGAPVVTDGVFSPGEWDDALKITIADGVTLLLKEHREVVFLGVRGATRPSDLYLARPGGPIESGTCSAALVSGAGSADRPRAEMAPRVQARAKVPVRAIGGRRLCAQSFLLP